MSPSMVLMPATATEEASVIEYCAVVKYGTCGSVLPRSRAFSASRSVAPAFSSMAETAADSSPSNSWMPLSMSPSHASMVAAS